MTLIKSLKEINVDQQNFPIFFWSNWLKLWSNGNTESFIYYNEKCNAIVPFRINKLKFLNKADYFYIPIGTDGRELEAIREKTFIDEFHIFLKKKKICDVIFPPLHFCNFKSIPDNVIYYKLGIIVLKINGNVDEIFNKMTSNYRNEIRKALKNNVKAAFGNELLNEVHTLYTIPHKIQKIQFEPLLFFDGLKNAFVNNIQFGVSYKDDSAETAILNLFDKNNAYYFYAGTNEKITTPGSNKLLLWESIKFFKTLGIKEFILGGYRDPNLTDKKHNGIQDFKLRFGADIIQGYHFIKVISPLRYKLFSFALTVKSFLYGKEFSFINKNGLDIKKS